MNNQINGTLLIGGNELSGMAGSINAINPKTNQTIEPAFGGATDADIRAACSLAGEAFDSYRQTPLELRARFLECIAEEIASIGSALIERAELETGLPASRLDSERTRTINQLQLFAECVRQGSWLGVRVDSAQPARVPLPRTDVRMQYMALGPVAVFGASNFPLAFSVAGGDTAAALAAGAPVVVKAHSAHPGTAELTAKAIQRAVSQCRLHPGVFAMLHGNGHHVGTALTADPDIKAVGFTGSRSGGTALMQVAASRKVPIPVYAEMSSINPVFLLPAALRNRADSMASDFVDSCTLGAGQFCTSPGLIIAIDSVDLTRFIDAASELIRQTAPQVMLTPGIHAAYESSSSRLSHHSAVSLCAEGVSSHACNRGQCRLCTVSADAFMHDAMLSEEVFGATSLIVRCHSEEQMRQLITSLEGQLTATLQMEDPDLSLARKLLPALEKKVGRILCNGWPTGVEVCHAMVHGGPYPASADGRSTSVGTAAIERFLRPVCYQNLPDALLPDALKVSNPLTVPRLLDGQPDIA